MRLARLLRLAIAGAGAAAALVSSEARATECKPASGLSPCIDADNLWAHAGGGPFFAIGSTTTTPRGQIAFGLVGSLLSQPIGLGVASADPRGSTVFAVDKVFDATLLFAVGVTDRLELTLAAPAALYQSGVGLGGVTGTGAAPSRSAVRDTRLGFTLALLTRPRVGVPGGPALTARFEVGLPVGTRSAFAGGATAVAAPSLVFDYRVGRFDFAAEASARVRGQVVLADAVMATQIGGALGATFDAVPDRWLTVGAEAFALPTIAAQLRDPHAADPTAGAPPLVPAEWIASISSARLLGGDVVLSLGGGGTIPTGSRPALTSPQYRLDFGIRYAPTGRDSDGDGVPDSIDKCPNEPEDRDGFQDADGCPDPDNDGDGIPDRDDKCPNEPEDFDGFQDADGCPDLDDDGDGIPDTIDKCRNEPEDFDGFQDADGCPDLDNDGDGIPDARDKCPNEPEDKDGFQDADGCPDPDNDGDGIPDAVDQCPNDPEDFDGFQDADGCPDLDDDEDGVPDALDKCPRDPETINGVEDADGCPEKGARSLVRWSGDRVLVEAPARFAAGKAEPPAALKKQLAMMAQLVRGRTPLAVVVLEAYADGVGDGSVKGLELAAARAEAVKKVFVAAGVPAAVITAAAGDPAAKRASGAPSIDVTAQRRARGGKPRK
jgi:hypothetical protein